MYETLASLTLPGSPVTIQKEGKKKVRFPIKTRNLGFRVRRLAQRGQVLIEYLMMTLMLLALFTGLYKVLQSSLRTYFAKAGQAILTAYY
ncbi:MAG: hypothetical protein COB53_00750 [Elusimicrobia bacterium]|nr:MAG: hypothetical protein COB53_00750 [Elusimicrobiota bacterium]